MKSSPGRRRTSKSDAAACGAFVGAMFGGASLVLSGGFMLAATKTEEQEIGEALAECLDTLPAPIGDAVSKGGPWLKLGSRLGGAVMAKMAIVHQHSTNAKSVTQTARSGGQPPPVAGARGPIAAPLNEVVMPDPSKAGTGASPWGAGDVIAPEPVAVGNA